MLNEIVTSNIPRLPIRINAADKSFPSVVNGRISVPHYHDEIELLYILKGGLKLITPEDEYVLSAGEAVFVASRVVHETFSTETEMRSVLIQFKVFDYLDDIGKNMARFINLNEVPVFKFEKNKRETKEIEKIIEKMAYEYRQREQAYEIYIKGDIYNMIGLLMRQELIKDNSVLLNYGDSERLLPVIDYIDKNYAEKITLEELGKLVNLNCEYLCRLFKKMSGSTLGDYINFVRVSKAEKLLSTTDKTISEISMDTGFASVSYFNRVFKKYKKCSPSAYKKIKFARQ